WQRDRAARHQEQLRQASERDEKARDQLVWAEGLRQQARSAPPEQARGFLAEALAAAQRADGVLAEGEGDEELRQEVRDLVEQLRQEERQRRLALGQFLAGSGLFRQGRNDEAIAAYQKALALSPRDAVAHKNL